MSDTGNNGGRSGGRIRLPLLDRLLDADPAAPVDPPVTVAYAVEMLRQAVRRDLETLLNARRRRVPLPAGLSALPTSPLGYGIPDPTAGSFTEDDRREALAAEVEAAVRRFEPRLMNVRVSLAKSPKDKGELIDRTLRLRVEAVLRSDPLPEQITFETHLRPVTLDVAVRES